MRARIDTWLPWVLAAVALLLLLISGAFVAGVDSGLDIFISALALAFSGIGALIARKHPRNAIGWTFLGVAVAVGLASLAGSYARRWVEGRQGSPALGEFAAWYGNISWVPFILVPCTFVPLLFPDGRLLSPRWRWVAWSAAAGIAGTFAAVGLTPGPIDDFPQLMNPYAVQSPLLDPGTAIAALLLLIGIGGSCASLILRFRRAHGERRQQIKWLALAAVVAGVTVPVAAAGSDLWGEAVANGASMLAVLCLPLAAGVAILRYRLYDIDVVINRTLVYGALTATLGGAYLALVLLIGLAVGQSDLAVATSTLAVAALFRP
ncbi:MAG TPA: hypothetical protein VGP30_04675, partial [Candidatus Limnocylindrales bacterium]|nr:hypothetical protein [Candidatus Limnocylindrales bacterium]